MTNAISTDQHLAPAGGLNHAEVDELATFIRALRDDLKLTVLLVEHHMNLVMRVSDHVHVLNFGRTIASGPPAEIRTLPLRNEKNCCKGRNNKADLGDCAFVQRPDRARVPDVAAAIHRGIGVEDFAPHA